MSKRKQKLCKAYKMTFWDHCLTTGDEAKPIKCEAYGLLYRKTNLAYYLCSWLCNNTLGDSNSEITVVLKSAVIKMEELETKK